MQRYVVLRFYFFIKTLIFSLCKKLRAIYLKSTRSLQIQEIITEIRNASKRVTTYVVPLLFILLLIWRGTILELKLMASKALSEYSDIVYLDSLSKKNFKLSKNAKKELYALDTIQTNTAHSRYQDELAKRKDNLLSKAFQYAALKRLADSIREKSEN